MANGINWKWPLKTGYDTKFNSFPFPLSSCTYMYYTVYITDQPMWNSVFPILLFGLPCRFATSRSIDFWPIGCKKRRTKTWQQPPKILADLFCDAHTTVICARKMLEVLYIHSRCIWLLIEWSELEPWPRTLYSVVGQDTLFLQFLCPPSQRNKQMGTLSLLSPPC